MIGALLLVAAIALGAPAASAVPAVAPPAPRAADPAPLHEDPAPAEEAPPSLESRIPPVSGQAFGLAQRLELTPGIGMSLNDPFIQKFIPELSIGYHLSQAFYLGLRGGYAVTTAAGVVASCSQQGGASVCGPPSGAQLRALPGQMSGMGFVEFAWTPIYGKVNLFAEKVVHFDLSALLGAGALVVGTPASPDGTVAAGSALAPALGPGLGERLFLSESMALSAELRDYLFATGGIQSQLMFHLGLAIFFGGAPSQG